MLYVYINIYKIKFDYFFNDIKIIITFLNEFCILENLHI